ncbi:MAG: tetratricopeptide repeat protein [Lachnospiraceae bacterium]|nr:tetratricopeptide repeat protein [Lachnospiraceae bacterium]
MRSMVRNHLVKKSLVLLLTASALLTTACGADTKAQASYKKAGIEKMADGRYEDAIREFNKALNHSGTRINAEVIDINYYKAAAQTLSGKDEAALKTYTSIIDAKKSADAYYLRGAAYLKQKKVTKAVSDFKKSIAMDKTAYERYFRVYYSLVNADRSDQADRFLDLVLDFSDKDGKALEAKGKVLEIRKDYTGAIRYYKKALKKDLPEARIDMARAYLEAGDSKSAESQIKAYQKSEKETAESLNAIGELQMTEKKYSDALKSFQKGLKLKDSSMKKTLLRNELIALEYSGDFTSAKKKCESYVKAYPGDTDMAREYQFLETR